MKLGRVIWGMILLFIGIVLLLENFGVIQFYWRNVWQFWPIFLIVAGVNILFNRSRSQTGNMICLGLVVVLLGMIFYKGQQPPSSKRWLGESITKDIGDEINDDREDSVTKMRFSEPYVGADSAKKTVLNINGGGTSFSLTGETNDLIFADVDRRSGKFILQKESTDSVNTINFKMKDKKNGISFNDGGNDVSLKLNKKPEWNINMNMGLGEINLDMTDYKMRSFRFDGGGAALNITLGKLLPVTDVTVKTGIATVKIKIPETSGCRIKTKTGLSAKDFSGFIKIDNNNYETANYNKAAQKIFINLDGGLSNFEVNRY